MSTSRKVLQIADKHTNILTATDNMINAVSGRPNMPNKDHQIKAIAINPSGLSTWLSISLNTGLLFCQRLTFLARNHATTLSVTEPIRITIKIPSHCQYFNKKLPFNASGS